MKVIGINLLQEMENNKKLRRGKIIYKHLIMQKGGFFSKFGVNDKLCQVKGDVLLARAILDKILKDYITKEDIPLKCREDSEFWVLNRSSETKEDFYLLCFLCQLEEDFVEEIIECLLEYEKELENAE